MTEKENNIEQAKLWGLFFIFIGVLVVVVPKKMAEKDAKKEAAEYCLKEFPPYKYKYMGDDSMEKLGEMLLEGCLNEKGYYRK